MVYCGRPSTGCGNCKKRRIKCDENRPQCQHCVKTGRECPGYPAEIDLLLRKETPGLRRKARKALSEIDVTSSSLEKKSLQWVHVGAPRANSVPDVAQEAEFDSFIKDEDDADCMNDSVVSLQEKYAPSDSPGAAATTFENAQDNSLLSLATKAVATAIMATSTGLQHLTEHAARSYGEALAVTQKAMQHPAHATNDETLLAILLLALYESIANTHHSMAAWNKHVEGAIAIVRARDVQQFAELDSLSLFRTVRTQMLTSGLHHRHSLIEHLSFVDQSSLDNGKGAIDQPCSANIDPMLSLDSVGYERPDCTRNPSDIERSRSDPSSVDEIDQ